MNNKTNGANVNYLGNGYISFYTILQPFCKFVLKFQKTKISMKFTTLVYYEKRKPLKGKNQSMYKLW